MTVQPVDPNKDGTYEIRLGSTFDDVPRQTLHALKCTIGRLCGLIVDNFKPAAIDYAQMGSLTSTEDGSGEVSLALPSTSVHTELPCDGMNMLTTGWRVSYFQRTHARSQSQ